MADTEVVGKVGRGGAGNFYTRKDVADVNASIKEDLETQAVNQETESTNTEPSESQTPSKYAHAGRGGAGNYYEPSVGSGTLPSSDNEYFDASEDQITNIPKPSSTASTPAKATPPPPKSGVTMGRGGAGNWFESTHARAKREAEERRVRAEEVERVERMVRESIEAQLTKPQKTYRGVETERGVRVGKTRVGVTLGDDGAL